MYNSYLFITFLMAKDENSSRYLQYQQSTIKNIQTARPQQKTLNNPKRKMMYEDSCNYSSNSVFSSSDFLYLKTTKRNLKYRGHCKMHRLQYPNSFLLRPGKFSYKLALVINFKGILILFSKDSPERYLTALSTAICI